MKRTEELFRSRIRKDVKSFYGEVVEELAAKLLQKFLKENLSIDLAETSFALMPRAKQEEYRRFKFKSELTWSGKSALRDDIAEMIDEEICLYTSQLKPSRKPPGGAKSEKA
tara:strand:+ start:125 stop:460 length:336 start_codon:yes stop_codon:yes gene_type:complete